MSLLLGSRVEQSKFTKREIFVPVHSKSGGFLGILRIVFIGLEVILSFIPGIGQLGQALIATAGAVAQASITLTSYAQGNIRSTGNLISSLALDLVAGVSSLASYGAKSLKSSGIVIESLDEALETVKTERLLVKGTDEYKEFNSILKTKGVKSTIGVSKINSRPFRISRVNANKITQYRQALIKAQAALGEETELIKIDEFERLLQEKLSSLSNKDLSAFRNIKRGSNLRGGKLLGEKAIIDELSPLARGIFTNDTEMFRNLISDLAAYTNSNKITAKINRIFASGEADWSTREFWRSVKTKQVFKSGNFYTQAAQMLSANDVGRELITKPFNSLTRQVKKGMSALRKRLKKWKGIGKAISAEERLKRVLEKEGRLFENNYTIGYRILQDLGKTKTIIVHFDRLNTAALTPGSKNFGGKKPVVLVNIPNHMIHRWNKAANPGAFYNRYFALSNGGRAIGFEVADHMFGMFLTFVPLPALRNILSVMSNLKGVAKDIARGKYFSSWTGKFKETVNRLWIHKIGKLGGSFLSIGGKGLGKEGQRIGLGIAKGFQHSKGQKFGSFNWNRFAKDVSPNVFAGTAKRVRRNKFGSKRLTASQSSFGIKRVGTNLRRIPGAFRF